jgi:hypothetical protein
MGNNLIDILFSYPKGQGHGGLCHFKYVKIHRKRMDLYFSIKLNNIIDREETHLITRLFLRSMSKVKVKLLIHINKECINTFLWNLAQWWMKKREIFLQGHAQGQCQLSRSKTFNVNNWIIVWYILMKLTTVIENNKMHLSARSHQGQGQLSMSKIVIDFYFLGI